jgi:hypothetical protein
MNPTAAARPARRRRFTRVALPLTVLAVAVYAGWLVYSHYSAARDLRDAIAEVEATDPRWRLEHVQADRAAVPDAENAVTVIRRAQAGLARYTITDRQQRDQLTHLPLNTRLTDDQHRAVRAELKAVESAIGPALELARFLRGRHPDTFTSDGSLIYYPDGADIDTVHFRVLEPLVLALAHEGDAPAGVQACRATLNIGRSIGDDPYYTSQLIRSIFHNYAVRELERVLGQMEVPDQVLAVAQADLAAEADFDPWDLLTRGERAAAFEALEAVRTGHLKLSTLRTRSAMSARAWWHQPPPYTPATQVRDWIGDRSPPDVRRGQAWLLRHLSRLRETARLPWPRRRAAVEALMAERADAPELARLALDEAADYAKVFQLGHARGRCSVTAVAAERYRLRHGAWPAGLAALVPEFLPEVPVDPFDGRPLRYRRLADGVVIYSVSEDGIDDGGHSSDLLPPPAGTDVGFRLWDVPHRRQPAIPEAPP